MATTKRIVPLHSQKILVLLPGYLFPVPRSCEESLAFGRNYTGLHTLRSLDGANYTAFCQFEASTHTGLTFVSKFAVAYHDLDIHLMFTDR